MHIIIFTIVITLIIILNLSLLIYSVIKRNKQLLNISLISLISIIIILIIIDLLFNIGDYLIY
jgi:hypothetical protein